MKKLLSMMLALMMCLSLVSCGSGGQDAGDSADVQGQTDGQNSEPQQAEEPEEVAEEPEEPDTITITIPAILMEGETVSGLVENENSEYYQSATENEDGSVTVVMTMDQHGSFMEKVKEGLLETTAETFPSEDYPSIQSVEYSDDFTEMTMTVDYDAYSNSFDALASYIGIMACQIYQVLDGVNSDEVSITINVVDESGEVKETSNYPEDYGDLSSGEEEATDASTQETDAGSALSGVEIIGASLGEDYEGNPSIIVTLSWTNNTDETNSFMWALSYTAFQDGIEMDQAYTSTEYSDNAYKEVKPGATITVDVSFLLGSESVVEFEISDLLGDDTLSDEFDPAELK